MAERITKLQLIDHGIEHEQYFQGCGVSFTSYSYCVTGIGDDIREAIEDCLDQIAMQHTGVDNWPFVERLICEQQLGAYEMNDIRSESVSDHIAAERGAMADNHEDTDDLGCEHHYYVSIRYNLIDNDPIAQRNAEDTAGEQLDSERFDTSAE